MVSWLFSDKYFSMRLSKNFVPCYIIWRWKELVKLKGRSENFQQDENSSKRVKALWCTISNLESSFNWSLHGVESKFGNLKLLFWSFSLIWILKQYWFRKTKLNENWAPSNSELFSNFLFFLLMRDLNTNLPGYL